MSEITQKQTVARTVPAAWTRLPNILTALSDTQSVTKALQLCGVSDYVRISTRLTARAATPTQALHLRLQEGAPVLHSVGVNADVNDIPVEYGRTFFAGERVTLTLDRD